MIKQLFWKSAKLQDFIHADVLDWIEGVGEISTQYEKKFINAFGKALQQRNGEKMKHTFTAYVTRTTYNLTREIDESEDSACVNAIEDFEKFMKIKQRCQMNDTCIEITNFDIGDVL